VLYSVKENTTGDILEMVKRLLMKERVQRSERLREETPTKKLRKSKILLMRYRILLKRWT